MNGDAALEPHAHAEFDPVVDQSHAGFLDGYAVELELVDHVRKKVRAVLAYLCFGIGVGRHIEP